MNQDFYYSSDQPLGKLPNFYVVADGMGGHRAGDYASRFTVTELVKKIPQVKSDRINEIIDLSLHEVNARLHETSSTVERYRGCGTTVVAASIDGSNWLHVANVGDSRLYVIGQDEIRQITTDHSLVEEMVLAGSLDQDKARTHPRRNVITRAVGVESYVDIDFFTCELHRGDLVLLCSDGLTTMMEDRDILKTVRENETLQQKAQALVDGANAQGGADNITVTIIDAFAGEE